MCKVSNKHDTLKLLHVQSTCSKIHEVEIQTQGGAFQACELECIEHL